MDVNSICQAIGSVGFPIIACVYLYLHMEKQDEQHKEEMGEITKALNNNTIALTKLTERMGVDTHE